MKLSTYSMNEPERLSCFQQIAVHLGGMTRAVARHYPINWSFHWSGICRAIWSSACNPRKRTKSNYAQAQ
jgi:hypothetical protein